MLSFPRRLRLLAASLSALAGFVDAVAFVGTGGFFVSFMSGNSTRLGVGLARDLQAAGIAGALIAAFVGGVVLGSLVGRAAGARQRPVVLGLVTLLLVLAAVAGARAGSWLPMALLAVAMGAENAVFEEDGETRVGLTYMTGALVKVGQRLAAAARGGPAWAWSPWALLWAGLVGGAALGAAAHAVLGLGAIWLAAAAAAALTGAAILLEPRTR